MHSLQSRRWALYLASPGMRSRRVQRLLASPGTLRFENYDRSCALRYANVGDFPLLLCGFGHIHLGFGARNVSFDKPVRHISVKIVQFLGNCTIHN
jgi:hypothetical protein